jgi:hypothetical protein
MFCPNCSCELPAVAKFCVKCGSRVEAPPTASRALGSFCINCAKPLDSSDKFCSYCGHEVIPPQSQHAQMARDIATANFEKLAERYSQMSNGELVRLSADLSQLTEAAQKALISEISKRALQDSPPILAQTDLSAPPVKQSQAEGSPHCDYNKMSDEELQQLCAAYQKLHQPISDSLRSELDLRTSRRIQAVSTPPSSPTQIAPTIQATATAQAPTGVKLQKSPSAPYAKFVVLLLIFCLCASVGVFALFDALARDTTSFAVESLSILLTLVFGWLGWTTWKSILKSEPRNEVKSKHRVRNAVVTSVVFVLLYLGLAALLGSIIGQNRAEATQLNSDINRQKELADRITKARNAVSNYIPSYLTMYAGIESDVNNYSSTLLRLRQELPLYNSKFPDQAETMRKYANTIEREIRRSDLLKKQIATAKQIALLEGDQQGPAWRSEMVPLLEEEDSLDRPK